MRFRLLSLLIITCLTLLTVRLVNYSDNDSDLSDNIFVSASAEDEEEEESEDEEEQEEDEEAEETEDTEEGDEKEGEEGSSKESSERPESAEDSMEFSQTELDILQRLSKRREKLEEWQADLEVKESILNITQTKIDQKIVELRQLKQEVEALLTEYNTKEDEKTSRLVKVYETMKPKDASEIFAQLEMDTLLLVASKMKEAKLALVLAQMDPGLAKELTERFAAWRRLSDSSAEG